MDLIDPDPTYTRIAELRKQLIQSRLLCLALLCALAFTTGLYARAKKPVPEPAPQPTLSTPPVKGHVPDRIIRPRNRPKNTVA